MNVCNLPSVYQRNLRRRVDARAVTLLGLRPHPIVRDDGSLIAVPSSVLLRVSHRSLPALSMAAAAVAYQKHGLECPC